MVGNKYRKKCELYKRFADGDFDYSEKAIQEMFDYESKGIGNCNIDDRYNEYLRTGREQNGYAIGKRMLDITVGMWNEDVEKPGWGLLIDSLVQDFDKDWLLSVFSKKEKVVNYIKEEYGS